MQFGSTSLTPNTNKLLTLSTALIGKTNNGYRATARFNASLLFTFCIFVFTAELRLAGRCASLSETANQ